MKRLTIAVGLLALATLGLALYVFMRDDPTVLVSTDVEHYAPLPEDGEESFALLLEMTEQDYAFEHLSAPFKPTPEEYQTFLIENQDTIIQNFAAIQPAIPYLEELANYDAIGDPATDFSSEIISFQGFRAIMLSICQYVELAHTLNLENDGFEEFLLLEKVMTKWQPHTRTLVSTMVGTVITEQTQETALRIIPDLKQNDLKRLADSYSVDLDYKGAIIRSMYCEYALLANGFPNLLTETNPIANLVAFNPNATLNALGSYITESEKLIQRKDWHVLKAYELRFESEELERIHIKNFAGWKLLSISVPAYSGLSEKAHETDEQRAEVQALIAEHLEDQP